MAVYVDDMEAPYGRLIMCHMVADTHRELVEMADRIGVARKWLQMPNTSREHFDVCQSKRRKAVALGAVELTRRALAQRLIERGQDENGERAYYEEEA